jgi:hypothetical protein
MIARLRSTTFITIVCPSGATLDGICAAPLFVGEEQT